VGLEELTRLAALATTMGLAGLTLGCTSPTNPDSFVTATTFAAFGDSITWGEDGQDFCTDAAAAALALGRPQLRKQIAPAQQYPSVLLGELHARYVHQSFAVVNDGQRGERAADAPPRFSATILTTPPSYESVLLMEGANDLCEQCNNMAAIEGLRTMIRGAAANGIRPFLATIPPQVAGRRYLLDPMLARAFNDQVRGLAAQERVTLVDVEGGFDKTGLGPSYGDYISCDGLHPTASGYALIANIFFIALTQALKAPASSTTNLAVPSPVLRRSPARRQP
jgi:lysophospholipase L1-like esterase